MLVNYATILYTPKDVQIYADFYRRNTTNGRSTHWFTQYLDNDWYKLPVVVNISKSGYPNHQGVYEYSEDPLAIYSRYFSDTPLIPLEALLNPDDYPEYYI